MRPTPPADRAEPLVVPAPRAHDPELPFVWRCAACLRRQPFGFAELERFTRSVWPTCCGETVLGFLAACEPAPPDEPRRQPD
jgi:hypothetical protein